MTGTVLSFDDAIGSVFRHNRLFNYLISPLEVENGVVKCQSGKNAYRNIPMDYFKRDWRKDDTICYDDLVEKVNKYPDNTPFTIVYDTDYEIDDGVPHSYIHYNDDANEKMHRFPLWRLTSCTKSERNEKINPYTLIMPVKDGMEAEIQKELDLINEIRKENEFIQIDDFQGFEFGLIKLLEKKYLRLV